MSERIAKAGAEFGQAIADELAAIRRDMLTKDDAKNFLTKDDAKNFATKDDLKNFATKDDLKQFATKDDLKQFVTKEDAKQFATKDDIKLLIEAINDHTIALREELNFQFKKVNIPIVLTVKPRKKA